MFLSPALSLTIWDQTSDSYSHNQLADNFNKLDQHDHSPGRGIQISTASIRSQAITTEKIAPGAVTPEKLAPGSIPGLPAGLIFPFAGTSLPHNMLFCNGEAVSRVTYARLFEAIGTRWGAGDHATTFNLPETENGFLIGAGGAYTVGTYGGSATQTLRTSNLARHNHGGATGSATSSSAGEHIHQVYVYNTGTTLNGSPSSTNPFGGVAAWALTSPIEFHVPVYNYEGFVNQLGNTNIVGSHTHTIPSLTIANEGSGQPFEIIPPYVAVLYVITI